MTLIPSESVFRPHLRYSLSRVLEPHEGEATQEPYEVRGVAGVALDVRQVELLVAADVSYESVKDIKDTKSVINTVVCDIKLNKIGQLHLVE